VSTTLEATLDATTNTSSPTRLDHGVERGTAIGRYVVLAELGAGGMGLVYAAYDPELDRKVAIKLVRSTADENATTTSRGHTRLLREAQALAKLSHTNVVAVHDVGTFGERVWIAMEFVEGQTLAAWARQTPRSWREVLDVMQPALRGIAVAHAAGLTHRDVKPDNIMVGSDGRVRVMDFGLALAQPESEPPSTDDLDPGSRSERSALAMRVTRGGTFPGTPAYMSPEQFRIGTVDAKSDQFSCCVVLWELLYGERPFAGSTLNELAAAVLDGRIQAPPPGRRVPKWLRRACERGLSPQPEKRFASIEALLEALARGQAGSRRRRVYAGLAAVALLGGGAQIARTFAHARRVAACEDAGASIEEIWNDAARERVRGSLRATGVGHAAATADRVLPWLDRRADEWRVHRTLACTNTEVERTWDARISDAALWCLEERRLQLASLVSTFSEANVDVAARAVIAAAGLPAASLCVDESAIARLPSPPPPESRAVITEIRGEVLHADALTEAGKYGEALAHARSARERTQAVDWPPLSAAATFAEAEAHRGAGEFDEATKLATAAYMAAAASGTWDVAAAAATDLVYTVGVSHARHSEGRLWAKNAEIAIALAGDPLATREHARLNALGIVEFVAGNFAAAKRLRQQALAMVEASLGPDHPRVAIALSNLAHVCQALAEFDEAEAMFQRSLAIRERELGPDHPDVIYSLTDLGGLAWARGDYATARQRFEGVLEKREAELGPEHYEVGRALVNVAIAYEGLGQYAEARDLDERALPIMVKTLGPDHPDVASTMSNLANVYMRLRDHAKAKALHERALAIRTKALGPDHPAVGQSLGNLVDLYYAMGDIPAAIAASERALAIREKTLGPTHPDVANSLQNFGAIELETGDGKRALALIERAVSIYDMHGGVQEGELSARFGLARALAATRGDMTRARVEAEKARDGFERNGRADRRTEIDAWLAAHPR